MQSLCPPRLPWGGMSPDPDRPALPRGWWVLRRGWVTHAAAAGLAAGVLAELAGVAMLELHCANLEALHVLVWHTLVVPVSGVAGAIVGWALRGCDWL